MFNHKKSGTFRYWLVALFILTMLVTSIFFYLKKKRVPALIAHLKELWQNKTDFSAVDSCVILLYRADNDCRLYEVTANKKYIQSFNKKLDTISNIVAHIDTSSNGKLADLFEQKRQKTQLYLKLKKLTDSLVKVSAGIDTVIKPEPPKVYGEFKFGKFRTMITVDTIKTTVQDKSKKKLFGRLVDAFKDKRSQDSLVATIRKEVKLDTAFQSKQYNLIHLKRMNNYFRNLYARKDLLSKAELDILGLNTTIIGDVVKTLKNYKANEIILHEKTEEILRDNIDANMSMVDKLYKVALILLCLLGIIILYNLFKMYKNEKYLVDYTKKATQYAQSKSRFLANMSHEIRTPLNSVIGFSEQLIQQDLTSKQSEQVNAIRTSSIMLLDVVNDILDFSKYETGKVSFDEVVFNPAELLRELISSISIQASAKGLKLEADINFNNSINLKGDSLRLKQVVMNLLSNAIKFTDHGLVTLKADIVTGTKKQEILKIQVADTGVGIAQEDIYMIFEEFAQVYYSSSKVKQKGTGLGLAICKRIVELQGGTIGVESEVGKGSNFFFEIGYEHAEMKDHQQLNIIGEGNLNRLSGKRVLLADDNKMNILLAETVIKKYNIDIDTALDGKQALHLFENNNYDLILTDIQMPEMGGVELTQRIRKLKNKSKSSIHILAITANVLEEDRIKYLSSGINDLVLKPFSEKELMDKITKYIS